MSMTTRNEEEKLNHAFFEMKKANILRFNDLAQQAVITNQQQKTYQALTTTRGKPLYNKTAEDTALAVSAKKHQFIERLSITKHDELNYLTRWLELSKFIMAELQCFFDSLTFHLKGLFRADNPIEDNADLTADLQGGVLIASGTGLLVGIISHYYFKRWYNPRSKLSMNPLYRNFKTLASVGATLGIVLGYLLPLPRPMQKIAAAILTDICCIGLGLLAFPYWLLREKVFKIDNTKSNYYARIGKNDGWSKYGKAAFVYGIVVCQMISGFYAIGVGKNLAVTMILGGGIGGVAFFVGSLIFIPLINWVTDKLFKKRALVTDHKDTYRSNYLRSGITGFLALGMIIGFGVGLACPGLGIMACMTLCGAVSATFGGILLGATGGKISSYAKKKFGLESNADTDNDVDYTTRNCAYMFGFLFAAIFFFMPIPGGPLIAAALGTAVGGAVGWVAAFKVMHLARKIDKVEEKVRNRPDDKATLAWTQRVASMANAFSIVGAIVGFGLGFIFGPMGAILGSAFCFALFGFVGGVVGALIDPTARRIIKETIFGTTKKKIEKYGKNDPALTADGTLKIMKMYDAHNTKDAAITNNISSAKAMLVEEEYGMKTYYSIQSYVAKREQQDKLKAKNPVNTDTKHREKKITPISLSRFYQPAITPKEPVTPLINGSSPTETQASTSPTPVS